MAHELRIGPHFFVLVRKALGTRSGVTFCACKFMLTYINLKLFRVGWGGVDYLKYVTLHGKTGKKVMTRARYFNTLDKRKFF